MFTLLSVEATSPEHPAHTFFSQRYDWTVALLRESFERAADDGQVQPGVDPNGAARGFVALMDGLQVQWLYDRESVDMASEVRRYVQSLLTVKL